MNLPSIWSACAFFTLGRHWRMLRHEGFHGWRLFTVSMMIVCAWPIPALAYVFDVYVYDWFMRVMEALRKDRK